MKLRVLQSPASFFFIDAYKEDHHEKENSSTSAGLFPFTGRTALQCQAPLHAEQDRLLLNDLGA